MRNVSNRDFLLVLRESLAKRISLNPRYSQAAFARDLQMTPGHLSSILQGKKGLSPERAKLIFKRLGLSPEESKFYTLQVAQSFARSRRSKKEAAVKLEVAKSQSTHQLTTDAFNVISDWHHFAILQALSLLDVHNLNQKSEQVKFIAKRLKLSLIEVETALERLLRLELVEMENDRLKVCFDTVFTTDGVPSEALRNFHTQILKKAIVAIELKTLDERYPNTSILPILNKDFENIRAEMQAFHRKIMSKYGRVKQGDGESVFALAQNFFKLSEDL